MCRFVFYRGEPIRISALITEPRHSIIHQSYHSQEREEPLNGDGFGIGWYAQEAQPEPAVFRNVAPAWNDMNLLNLAPVIRSHCIVGHIRAATPGLPVTQLNCHPFAFDRYLFAHNGEVGGFQSIRRELLRSLSDDAFAAIKGSTDSEHVFAMFLDELRVDGNGSVDTWAEALQRVFDRLGSWQQARGIEAATLLNIVVTDGESALISRFASGESTPAHTLYLRVGKRYRCVDGDSQMTGSEASRNAVLVASEPITPDDEWTAIPRNTMQMIDADLNINERQITAA